MDNDKITNHQLFSTMANFVCGTSMIISSAPLAAIAKHDAWISALILPILGVPLILTNFYIMNLYPGKTYMQIIQLVFGKWIGLFVYVNLLFVAFLAAPQVLWYVGDFFTTTFMPETPSYAINLLFIVALTIGLHYGLETLLRSAGFFIYIVSGVFLLSMIFVLPNARIENLQPIFEKGIIPVLKGTHNLASFTTFPLIFMFTIFPLNIYYDKKAKKYMILGYLWGLFLVFISIMMCILVLGSNITASSMFPVYNLVKEINLGVVLNRLEALITGVWVITLFFKVAYYFYSSINGISQLLKLSDHKRIIIPIGFLILLFSGIVYPDAIYEMKWDSIVWVLYISTFGFILPILLLSISIIKKLFKPIKS